MNAEQNQNQTIEVELQSVEQQPESQPEVEESHTEPHTEQSKKEEIVKHYEYNYNGKPYHVTRKYTVKFEKSFKNKTNKETMHKYVEEHKQRYLELPPHRQVTALRNDIKKDLDLDLSRTGALTLLVDHNIRLSKESK